MANRTLWSLPTLQVLGSRTLWSVLLCSFRQIIHYGLSYFAGSGRLSTMVSPTLQVQANRTRWSLPTLQVLGSRTLWSVLLCRFRLSVHYGLPYSTKRTLWSLPILQVQVSRTLWSLLLCRGQPYTIVCPTLQGLAVHYSLSHFAGASRTLWSVLLCRFRQIVHHDGFSEPEGHHPTSL